MSDEPLFCTHCGVEMGYGHAENCPTRDGAIDDDRTGPFCHICADEGAHVNAVCSLCRKEMGWPPS